jgi:hypothetical protein
MAKSRRMGFSRRVLTHGRECIPCLVEIQKERVHWEDNIEMDLRDIIGWYALDSSDSG